MTMRRPRLFCTAAFLLLALPSPGTVELWISPAGSDENPGTAAQPFATVAAAQRHARELRRRADPQVEGGVQLVLRDGMYHLDQPLRFRPEDSGTADHPTTVRAAPGERPVLSGGVRLTGWRRPASAVTGLPEAAQAQVWTATAPSFHGRPLEFRQLWVGDRKATRARTPNRPAMARLLAWDPAAETATIPAELVRPLRGPADVELVVQQQWEIANLRIESFETAEAGAVLRFHQPESRLEFEHPWPQPILPPAGGGAFHLVNALEFLDEPGEWYLDRAAGQVYYWPRPGEDLATMPVVAPALETLVVVAGTVDRPLAHLTFAGLTFQHTTWLRPSRAGHVPLQAGMYLIEAYKLRPKGTPEWRSLDNQAWIGRPPAAVTVEGAHHTRFERCRFEHLAMNGLDYRTATHDDTIEGCVFRDLGGNGILAGDFQTGPIETHLPYLPADGRLVCRRLRIANNVVTDVANEDWGCVGIGIGYAAEVTVEHNEVFDVSYTAVSVGWGWTRDANASANHRIHANHLHHYATRMCDTAGVYTLSHQPGTVISENVVHGVAMSPYVDRPDHWFYLYLDEGSSFIQVRDNWAPEERFFENAVGPGNLWTNNGPQVSNEIRARAGLQPAFRDLLP